VSRRSRIVEVKTIGYRQERAGYGSSAMLGDAYQPLLPVPDFIPTTGSRFLFRLCAAQVAPNEEARVVSYKLTSLIGQRTDVRILPPNTDQWTYLVEREVVSPFWSFVDGNVTWYFRSVPVDGTQLAKDPLWPPSVDRELSGLSPALLALTYDPTLRLYTPPGGGGPPPGSSIAGLDTIREQPGVWTSPLPAEDFVKGPCVITMFASVLQTDPNTRPYLPLANYPNPIGGLSQGLRPEDQFLLSWGEPPTNRVQYTAVAGAFRVEYREQPCKETP